MNEAAIRDISMNPDVAALREHAIQSLTLAIELFNRPNDCARRESVIVLLHHSFEMLLKSVIVEREGTAFDEKRGFSYTFDTCLRLAEEKLALLQKDHRKFLSILDNLRDCVTHYYQDTPETVLYIFAQGSVSLFNELLTSATGKGLLESLPNRVLAVSAIPPQQVGRAVDEEFRKLCELLHHPDVNKQRAMAMLRPLMAFKIGGEEQHRRMTNMELEKAIDGLAVADDWRVVFPEIARIAFTSDGDAISVGFKVVKDAAESMSVRVLGPGDPTPIGGVIIQKEIDILDKFNLGLEGLAKHLGLTAPKTLALVREYHIQDDIDAFRQISFGKMKVKRYSKRAIDLLKGKVAGADEVWKKQRCAPGRREERKSK